MDFFTAARLEEQTALQASPIGALGLPAKAPTAVLESVLIGRR
jgi:hypothetical protein